MGGGLERTSVILGERVDLPGWSATACRGDAAAEISRSFDRRLLLFWRDIRFHEPPGADKNGQLTMQTKRS